ncbi:MAG: zinc ABC transporter solute-binding protein [Clostridia bacterium]|nr:zinc ABC transporter solute-binding protein [Clostridia bacterium]
MKLKKAAVLMLLGVLIFSAFGCAGNQEVSSPKGKIQVCTSIYPIYYFTSRIAGNETEVKEIMPVASDPHSWEPSPKDMAEIQKARVFIYAGAGLEPWAQDVAETLGENGTKVLEISKALFIGNNSHEDPHFWLDPLLAQKAAEAIKDLLVDADPNNKNTYENNYQKLASDLEALHGEYKQALSQCSKKEFVVTHSAFGYLAERYGLKQISIMGVSPESEPSPARLAELADQLKDKNIKYIFTEPFISPKAAEILGEETGAELLVLNPIGSLTKEQQREGKDYMVLMRENLEQLKVALECREKK